MKTQPEISITIRPAPIEDVRDPEFTQKARELQDLYRAAPELRDALKAMLEARELMIAAIGHSPLSTAVFVGADAAISATGLLNRLGGAK